MLYTKNAEWVTIYYTVYITATFTTVVMLFHDVKCL